LAGGGGACNDLLGRECTCKLTPLAFDPDVVEYPELTGDAAVAAYSSRALSPNYMGLGLYNDAPPLPGAGPAPSLGASILPHTAFSQPRYPSDVGGGDHWQDTNTPICKWNITLALALLL
jgi:hypothetical protein